jgi:uncharacterized Zn-finger protein
MEREITYSGKKEVACSGSGLGHPTVYLNMEPKGEIICPYCSKKFVFKKENV